MEIIKKIHPEVLLVPFKIIEKDKGLGDVLRWMLDIHAALAVYSYLGESKTYHIVDALGNGITVSKDNLPEVLAEEILKVAPKIRPELWVVNVAGHGFVALIGDQDPAKDLSELSLMKFDRQLECGLG